MQMWKLDGKKLRNKAGFWTSTDDWSLLKPGTRESILETDHTTVTIRNDFNKTYLEKSDDDDFGTSVVENYPQPDQDPQKWMMEKRANEKHFFKLKHQESGKYLTATSLEYGHGHLTIKGKA